MSSPAMTDRSIVLEFFAVVARRRSYLNLLYLLLTLPLGVFYFSFLLTGYSLGAGLSIIWVGLPILLLMVLATYALAALERQLAIRLLGGEVAPMRAAPAPGGGWPWLRSVLTGETTWKGLVFLIAKFPLGLASWVATVVLLSVSMALVFAPLELSYGGTIDLGLWQADTLPEALVCSLAGLLLGLVSLHFCNGLGWLWSQLAALLLGHGAQRPRPGEPAPSQA